ncbi:cell envelope integrity protein TolA [Noviherbaspirillum sp. ST9]|uniref:cell envelope integrity protein TolA n=1 Tax=Noviherbaspirillum sp. ST9 TaxID=3401606 RepID=UPI003B587650
MTDATPYIVPKEPGGGRALVFAALVHAALLLFLWVGVTWQSETPVTIEAEVWDPVPREAAPLPEPPKEKEPEPDPKPVVKEPPKPKVEEPPVVKPDIALEKEKKRKEEEKKKRLEDEAKEKKRQEEEKEKLAKLEEAKRQEKAKAEKAKKEAEDKKRKEEADQKLMAKLREDELKRMTGAVGTGGTGEAPKSQGGRADGDYVQRIAAKIRSNIAFIVPEGLQGNPPVEYEVRLLPDGSVAGIRKLKPSGVPGFDEAVSRAIERSQPYPRDKSGAVPATFIGIHKPKDQ